jgi:hypothetical protein
MKNVELGGNPDEITKSEGYFVVLDPGSGIDLLAGTGFFGMHLGGNFWDRTLYFYVIELNF